MYEERWHKAAWAGEWVNQEGGEAGLLKDGIRQNHILTPGCAESRLAWAWGSLLGCALAVPGTGTSHPLLEAEC